MVRLPFKDCADVTKRKRTSKLAIELSREELSEALEKRLKLDGCPAAAKIVKLSANEEKSEEILNSCQKSSPKKMSCEETLSMIINADLTERSFESIRSDAIEQGAKLYRSWDEVRSNYMFCQGASFLHPSTQSLTSLFTFKALLSLISISPF